MKRQIRKNIFETNSSSVHTLTMCSADEYRRWQDGEMVYDYDFDKLVEITPEIEECMKSKWSSYYTYDRFWEYIGYYDTFKNSYKTVSGDEVIAFGYYGYDG